MNENSSPLLDLRLAWRRILQDPADRAFVNHPFEFCLVQIDCEGFLNDLSKALQEKKFSPSPVYIANVPKGKGAVRPGAVLGIKDRIVYTACLGQMLPQVHRALKWNSQPIDFSYPITEHYEHDRWIVGQFKSWQQFRAASLDRLKGMSYAVLADITGYYENIDLATLRSDLATTGADPTTISLLMDCLNKWAQIGGRGIPQGLTPSDILGKLYLNSVDRALAESGYCHCRYVDDIRIFCPDYASAKKALVDLSVLLRKRGLNVQTAKSAIHRADEAKTQIEGITSVILDVRKRFLNDVQDLELLKIFA